MKTYHFKYNTIAVAANAPQPLGIVRFQEISDFIITNLVCVPICENPGVHDGYLLPVKILINQPGTQVMYAKPPISSDPSGLNAAPNIVETTLLGNRSVQINHYLPIFLLGGKNVDVIVSTEEVVVIGDNIRADIYLTIQESRFRR